MEQHNKLSLLTEKNITELLSDWGNNNAIVLEKLIPLVYEELHKLASCYINSERPNHTIQTTALVNEAYLRLAQQKQMQWQDRKHFFAVVARIMRHILINYARTQKAQRRGGGSYKVQLEEVTSLLEEKKPDLLALDEALNRLALIDSRKSKLVELRFFSGLNMEETAEVLEISIATAKRDWLLAKAWLYRELNDHII
jgi:RNA polymerase sigma factor (TIGR02999 family)